MTFWLGSDSQGRDMLSAIVYGLRISLGVGVASGLIAVCIGMCIGLVAGYVGGRLDAVIMRVVDLQLSFPSILVALMLLAVLGQGVDKIIIALVIVQWAYYTRTVRASALAERRREYIEAGRCLALGRLRIIFRHLLPNCLPPLIVVATRPGRPRHFPGGDALLSRARSAADRALSGAANRQRIRLHHERALLDQRLSRYRALAHRRVRQPRGRSVARRAQSPPAAIAAIPGRPAGPRAKPMFSGPGMRTHRGARIGPCARYPPTSRRERPFHTGPPHGGTVARSCRHRKPLPCWAANP